MDEWEGVVDVRTLIDENVHNGSQPITDNYQSGRSILAMETQDMRAWFCGLG